MFRIEILKSIIILVHTIYYKFSWIISIFINTLDFVGVTKIAIDEIYWRTVANFSLFQSIILYKPDVEMVSF